MDLKHDLAVLVGLVAHEYGHAETRKMLANLSAALRYGDGPEQVPKTLPAARHEERTGR